MICILDKQAQRLFSIEVRYKRISADDDHGKDDI